DFHVTGVQTCALPILGVVDTFPNQKPWVFVKEKQEYISVENPWHENLDYLFDNVNTSLTNINFTAVKAGDVNHSYSSDSLKSLETRTSSSPVLVFEDEMMSAGNLTSVHVQAKNLQNVLANQFTIVLSDGVEYGGFEAKALPLNTEQISYIEKNGKKYLTVAYHDVSSFSFEDGAELFSIHL